MKRFPSFGRIRLLMNCTLILVVTAGLPARAAPPQATWHLGLRTTGYFYQTEDFNGRNDDQAQGYQLLSASARGLGGGRYAVRLSGRLANDLEIRPSAFETSKLYSGYLEAKLGRGTRARVGRQLVLDGAHYQTLDGAWLGWSPGSRDEFSTWGGARAPLTRAAEIGDFEDESTLGARWARKWNPRLRSALSLAMTERFGLVSQQPIGLETALQATRSIRTLARAVYDLENEYWSRLQAQARWQPTSGPWSASAQFVDRRPFIAPGSYFYRFTNIERVRILRAALRHERKNGFGAEAEGFASIMDNRSASRMGLALLVPGGRVGWSVRLGDRGEEDRFYGEYGRAVTRWLRAEAAATFQTYALLSDAPTDLDRELTTFSARIRARLRPGLRLVAEVQSLDNPLYSKDMRFLCGIDLTRSGGAIASGLGHGGWLQ